MKTRIEERWDALSPDPERPVFQLVDAKHPLRLYIGRQVTGERLFLVVDKDKPPEVASMRALEISRFRRGDGGWGLLLALRDAELAPVFALLCNDLVECSRVISEESTGAVLLAARFAKWHALLDKRRADTLSASEVRGLFAELSVLRAWMQAGVNVRDAVDRWVGPLGADQDYQLGEMAWEIKSVQPDATSVAIASEKQLYSETKRVLLLVVVLTEPPEGLAGHTLNQLVRGLREEIACSPDALVTFEERLDAANYLVRDEYDRPLLYVSDVKAYLIGHGFPRLVRPELPAGVMNVRYDLDLPSCAQYVTEWPFAAPKTWN